MILNVERVLMDVGFPEFHVKKELYWPEGQGCGRIPHRRLADRLRRPAGDRHRGSSLQGEHGPPMYAHRLMVRRCVSGTIYP